GLEAARHALSVAAAGAHHALFVGPPGVGKTMLARRLPTIMAPLLPDEALEVAKVHSAAGSGRGSDLRTDPPFRAPHHSASAVSLIGGGSPRARPGEITLAHGSATKTNTDAADARRCAPTTIACIVDDHTAVAAF